MQQCKSYGFSLLEVLIALTLLSFMMIGVFSIVDSSTNTKEEVQKEDRDTISIEGAFNRLDSDLSMIYSPLYFDMKKKPLQGEALHTATESGQNIYLATKNFPFVSESGKVIPAIESEDDHTLSFMVFGHQRKIDSAKESGYAWVRYSLRARSQDRDFEEWAKGEDEEAIKERKGEYQIIRSYSPLDPFGDEVNWDKIKPQVLLNYVKELKFSFWDEKKKKFTDSLKDLENPGRPLAIQIDLVVFDNRGFEQSVSRLFRPIWPLYDAGQDEKEIKKFKAKNNVGTTPTPVPSDPLPDGGEQ